MKENLLSITLVIFENILLSFFGYQVSISEFAKVGVCGVLDMVFVKACANTKPHLNKKPYHLLTRSNIWPIFFPIPSFSFLIQADFMRSLHLSAFKIMYRNTNIRAKKQSAQFDAGVEILKNLQTTLMGLFPF